MRVTHRLLRYTFQGLQRARTPISAREIIKSPEQTGSFSVQRDATFLRPDRLNLLHGRPKSEFLKLPVRTLSLYQQGTPGTPQNHSRGRVFAGSNGQKSAAKNKSVHQGRSSLYSTLLRVGRGRAVYSRCLHALLECRNNGCVGHRREFEEYEYIKRKISGRDRGSGCLPRLPTRF